jgi:hypothetical protein
MRCWLFGCQWVEDGDDDTTRRCLGCQRVQRKYRLEIPETRHTVARADAVLEVVTLGVRRDVWLDD